MNTILTIKNIEDIIISSIVNKIDNHDILLLNIKEEFFTEKSILRMCFKELKDMFLSGSTDFQNISLFLTQENIDAIQINELLSITHEYTSEFLLSFILERTGKNKIDAAVKETANSSLSEKLHRLSTVTQEINETHNFDDVKDSTQNIESYTEYIELMNEKQSTNGGIVGISTGIKDLDEITMGLKNQDYIIVAARPSMGKTAFTTGLVSSLIYANEIPVFFSLEMPSDQIMGRLLSQINTELSLSQTMFGRDYENQKEHIGNLLEFLKTKTFFIEDFINKKTNVTKKKITVSDLDKKLASIQARGHKIGAIFIDFIQLISSEIHHQSSTNDKMSDISSGVKGLGRKYGCPVIALSQLNRELEKRQDKRPIMSDLRESGAIEQDADIIIFPYRPAVYLEKELKEKLKARPDDAGLLRELDILQNSPTSTAEFIIGKNRNGPTGYVNATFIKKTSSFVNDESASDDPFYSGEDIYV